MTVLVGYVPTAEGEAAFAAALDEARRRGEPLVVLNSPKSGAPVSAGAAPESAVLAMTARAEAAGVELDLRRAAHTGEVADEVLRVAQATNASVIVIGMRKRSPVGAL